MPAWEVARGPARRAGSARAGRAGSRPREAAVAADGRGLDMTGSAEAVAACDQAIDHLVRFQPEVVDVVAEAAAADPRCPIATVLRAYRLRSTAYRPWD